MLAGSCLINAPKPVEGLRLIVTRYLGSQTLIAAGKLGMYMADIENCGRGVKRVWDRKRLLGIDPQ
jgi:hypothetical protein